MNKPVAQAVIGEKAFHRLIMRHDGIADRPITTNERGLLLWLLYNESLERGGIVRRVREANRRLYELKFSKRKKTNDSNSRTS